MPAPMLGSHQSPIYRFRLGGFEVTNFLDGFIPGADPKLYGANQEPEVVAAALAANHLPTDTMGSSYTVTVVNTGDRVILFDTGDGARRRDQGAGRLLGLMAEFGPTPDQVDMVVLTHCHPDHIGGLMEDGALAFPSAEVVFGRKEFDYWMGQGPTDKPSVALQVFRSNAAPLANQARFIEPDETVAPGITSVKAFGHSPGHLGYVVESEGQRMLLWGDSANHYVLSIRDPGWHFAMDADRVEASASRRRLLEFAAGEGLLVSGYHLPFPALGYIDRQGGQFHWVPVGYQLSS